MRKDDERAPITIEARRAVDAGRGVQQDLLDLESRGEVRASAAPVGGCDAAEVHHSLHAAAARGVGEVLGGAAVAAGEVVVPGRARVAPPSSGPGSRRSAALERLARCPGR